MAHEDPLADVRELAHLLRPAWAEISAGIPDWHPRCEGEEREDEDSSREEREDEDEDSSREEPDWKAMSRKHEREAKKLRREREEFQRKLAEREDAEKTEHQKAIEKARAEAKAEALSEAEKERRNDRLEVAVARAAAKTFADVDDALLHVQRGITVGDIDPDDIFDDQGKVQADALRSALDELLERKPHLAATGRPSGSSDAGKGSGGKFEETDPRKLAEQVPRY